MPAASGAGKILLYPENLVFDVAVVAALEGDHFAHGLYPVEPGVFLMILHMIPGPLSQLPSARMFQTLRLSAALRFHSQAVAGRVGPDAWDKMASQQRSGETTSKQGRDQRAWG